MVCVSRYSENDLKHPQIFPSHLSTSQDFVSSPSQHRALICAGAMRACYAGNSPYFVDRSFASSSAWKPSVKIRVLNKTKWITKLACFPLNSELQSSRFSFQVGSFVSTWSSCIAIERYNFALNNSSWHCILVNGWNICNVIYL
jgi:hypothetical protein